MPSFEKISNSYGIKYTRITDQNNIHELVLKVLEEDDPVVCEVMMLHTHDTLPRNSTYKKEDGTFIALPMEDLLPLLDREEFNANMNIADD